MSEESVVEQLVARMREGDSRAEDELFHRYVDRLTTLARSHLDPTTKRKVDEDDIVQSVYRSFFLRARQGAFDLLNWESLWGLLTTITLRKCRRQREFHRAARRNVKLESPRDYAGIDPETFARSPSPDEAAILAETLSQLMSAMDQCQRKILTLGLQGLGEEEISEVVGRSQRTVRRTLSNVRSNLERMQHEQVK